MNQHPPPPLTGKSTSWHALFWVGLDIRGDTPRPPSIWTSGGLFLFCTILLIGYGESITAVILATNGAKNVNTVLRHPVSGSPGLVDGIFYPLGFVTNDN